MDSERIAQLTLATYAVLAAIIVAWQILRCPGGWRVSVLYFIDRLHCSMVFHWRSNRRCPLPAKGPAIVIANHRSPADPMILWMNNHLRADGSDVCTISFLMAREYYKIPGLRFICEAMQSIPIDRDGQDMAPARSALRRLQSGDFVGVFPEGRINTGDGLLDANPGVAWLALRAKVPVYPVFIHGSPRGKNMVEPFHTFARVRVEYGNPIDLTPYYDQRVTQELMREVTDLLMNRLAEVGGIDRSGAGHENR